MQRATTQAIVVAMAAMAATGCTLHSSSERAALVGNEVGRAELTASGASSLFDALIRTRRLFFQSRGASSLSNVPSDAILVFRGGALIGTAETLRTLRPADVQFVRRLTPTETYHKYGRRVSVAGFELELIAP